MRRRMRRKMRRRRRRRRRMPMAFWHMILINV